MNRWGVRLSSPILCTSAGGSLIAMGGSTALRPMAPGGGPLWGSGGHGGGSGPRTTLFSSQMCSSRGVISRMRCLCVVRRRASGVLVSAHDSVRDPRDSTGGCVGQAAGTLRGGCKEMDERGRFVASVIEDVSKSPVRTSRVPARITNESAPKEKRCARDSGTLDSSEVVRGGRMEAEFFDHYKNDQQRHAHTLQGL